MNLDLPKKKRSKSSCFWEYRYLSKEPWIDSWHQGLWPHRHPPVYLYQSVSLSALTDVLCNFYQYTYCSFLLGRSMLNPSLYIFDELASLLCCNIHPQVRAAFYWYPFMNNWRQYNTQPAYLLSCIKASWGSRIARPLQPVIHVVQKCHLQWLIPLRPVSLTHRNPQRHKIIHGMCPIRREDWLIDLNMCICRNILLVLVICVAVVMAVV